MIFNGDNLLVENCEFQEFDAGPSGDGPALRANIGGTLTITGSTFERNNGINGAK